MQLLVHTMFETQLNVRPLKNILHVKVSSKLAEGETFKLIDLDVTMMINPDDCQRRQVMQTRV